MVASRCPTRQCGSCAHRVSRGMRQVDPHVMASVRNIGQYRRALLPFMLFLAWYNLNPSDPEEFDDFLCEWKQDSTWAGSPNGRAPSRGEFEKCIAAVEKAVPKLKGQLPEAKAIARAWKSQSNTAVEAAAHLGPRGRSCGL